MMRKSLPGWVTTRFWNKAVL